MDYLIVKWIHILSSVVLVGTGFGTAFYMFFANRSKNVAAQHIVSRLVVRADLWFTTPAVIIQPLSGFYMVSLAGISMMTTPWLMWAVILYAITISCWIPVLWLQVQLRNMAEIAYKTNQPLPKTYWKYAKIWELLGYPAFLAMLGIFYLMVVKPQSISFSFVLTRLL